jgi:hypothetical protein
MEDETFREDGIVTSFDQRDVLRVLGVLGLRLAVRHAESGSTSKTTASSG